MSYYLLEVIGTNAILATLLAAGVVLISRYCERPALLHCLWIVVLAKLLMPASLSVPLVAVRTEADQPGSAVSTTALLDVLAASQLVATQPIPALTSHWWNSPANVAIATWIVGALTLLGWITWQGVSFARLIHRARSAPDHLQRLADAIAVELKLSSCPRVCIVQANISPLLWSVGRPKIVLPASLLRELNREEISGVLAHELMHLKRRDHWLRWLEIAAVAVYWWLPVAWWARRQLRAAEELCCDLAVLERWPAWAKDYARTLLKSNDWLTSGLPVPQTASGFGSAPFLKRRITMILSKNLTRRLSWPARVAVLLSAAAVLPLSPMSLRGDDDPGSKAITIEIKKDGTISISVGPPTKRTEAKEASAEQTSALAKGLQYIARTGADGSLTIQPAENENAEAKKEHPHVSLVFGNGENSDAGVSGVFRLQAAAAANEGAKGEEKAKSAEDRNDLELTTSGLLLQLADGKQLELKPSPKVSVEFSNGQKPGAEKADFKDGQSIKLFGNVKNVPNEEVKKVEAELQFTNALQHVIAVQAAASNLERIKAKEAELQQLNAQLRLLQAELETLQAQEKESADRQGKPEPVERKQ